MAPKVPRPTIDAGELVEPPTDQDLDPAEPEPVVAQVPVASATVVQAVAPAILASAQPIVIAAAWGRASGSATSAGRGLAVAAVLVPGQALASVPLVIGCGPMRAHPVPARRVFVCRPCSVEALPPAWMAQPVGEGAGLGLG